MKKAVILIILSLLLIVFTSCDMAASLEEFSDDMLSQLVNAGESFLKEDTKKNTETIDWDLVDAVTSSTDTGSVDTDSGESPLPPDVPQEPDIFHYIRKPTSLTDLYGFCVNDSSYRYNGDNVYMNALYSLPFANDATNNNLGYFKMRGIGLAPVIDTDFSDFIDSEEHLESKVTYKEAAQKISEYVSAYCNTKVTTYDVRRIVFGKDEDKVLSAQEYAKLMNLCYESFYNTENADKSIRLGMGSTQGPQPGYVKAVMQNLNDLREDGALPISEFCFRLLGDRNKTPEQLLLDNADLQELISFRDNDYPGITVSITEFGYNSTDDTSPSYSAPFGGFSAEEAQAIYSVRSMLIMSKLGIDSFAFPIYKDNDTSDYNGYGVIAKDNTKKELYYYLDSLQKNLGSSDINDKMYFDNQIDSGNEDILIYKFTNSNGVSAYAVWFKTNSGRFTDGFAVSIDGTSADLLELKKDSSDLQELTVDGGKVTVKVTEKPIIILSYNK